MPAPSSRRLIDLDDPGACARVDPGGLMRLVVDFPQQCREAWTLGQQGAARLERPGHIVIAGMGGSALGGALFASLFEHESPACLHVNRDYTLPGTVGRQSLVVAVSYSGETEETLAAFEVAAERGAQVVCITTGGTLAELAAEREASVIIVPGGQPPRTALGYLFFPLLAIAERAGVIGDQHPDFASAVRTLDEVRAQLGPEVPTNDNPAKQLARRLVGRAPFVYGSTSWLGIAAYRWRTQCNENAKALACSHVLPEMDHNEICGWGDQGEAGAPATPIFLRSSLESDRMRARLDATIDILGAHTPVEQVWGEGESALGQALSAIYYGDFVTVYLALLLGRDPMKIEPIDRLKRALSQ